MTEVYKACFSQSRIGMSSQPLVKEEIKEEDFDDFLNSYLLAVDEKPEFEQDCKTETDGPSTISGTGVLTTMDVKKGGDMEYDQEEKLDEILKREREDDSSAASQAVDVKPELEQDCATESDGPSTIPGPGDLITMDIKTEEGTMEYDQEEILIREREDDSSATRAAQIIHLDARRNTEENGRKERVHHQDMHIDKHQHQCSVCGKCFSVRSRLARHQITHAEEKPFTCSLCGKGFCRKEDLKIHQMIHSGEKPHECSTCGKSFGHMGDLRKHLNTHSGAKPFQCSHCGKSFSQLGNLKRHQTIHTGEKSYCCNDCGKGFAVKADLDRHQVTHSGERRFCCIHCGKCFPLRHHLKRHHKSHAR